jgi:hypothetical protein
MAQMVDPSAGLSAVVSGAQARPNPPLSPKHPDRSLPSVACPKLRRTAPGCSRTVCRSSAAWSNLLPLGQTNANSDQATPTVRRRRQARRGSGLVTVLPLPTITGRRLTKAGSETTQSGRPPFLPVGNWTPGQSRSMPLRGGRLSLVQGRPISAAVEKPCIQLNWASYRDADP